MPGKEGSNRESEIIEALHRAQQEYLNTSGENRASAYKRFMDALQNFLEFYDSQTKD